MLVPSGGSPCGPGSRRLCWPIRGKLALFRTMDAAGDAGGDASRRVLLPLPEIGFVLPGPRAGPIRHNSFATHYLPLPDACGELGSFCTIGPPMPAGLLRIGFVSHNIEQGIVFRAKTPRSQSVRVSKPVFLAVLASWREGRSSSRPKAGPGPSLRLRVSARGGLVLAEVCW